MDERIGYNNDGKMYFDNDFLELVVKVIDENRKETFEKMVPYIYQVVTTKEQILQKLEMSSLFIEKLDSFLVEFYEFELAHKLIPVISSIRNNVD